MQGSGVRKLPEVGRLRKAARGLDGILAALDIGRWTLR
jgi:hypothetical protein